MAAFFRHLRIGSNSKHSNIVQNNEYHMLINNSDWTIPEEKIEHIYRIGNLDFKTALSVKTHEETISFQEEFQTIPLINPTTIQKYLTKGYRHLNFGLIQIAVKPLVHLEVDAPIFMALRDKRLKKYKTSLLAMIQTNVCNGPIYFNCAPRFSIDMTHLHILNSMVLIFRRR